MLKNKEKSMKHYEDDMVCIFRKMAHIIISSDKSDDYDIWTFLNTFWFNIL